ncbi:MAG: serine protease [Gammaproteobacteria bacterium]|nr:serine protease [Gammaproteobacteria bacterium]
MIAGGSLDLSESPLFSCNGFTADAPDYQIDYSPGNPDLELSFFAVAEVDTVILINAPNGLWHCNDDFSTQLGSTAGLTFEQPLAGVYDIWVGVYDQDDIYSAAELYITELANLLDEDLTETDSSSETSSPGAPQVIGSGTAFAVTTEGHLITNYHVISGCNSLTFQIPGSAAAEAAVVSTNESSDLALLRTDIPTRAAQFHTRSRIRLGDEIVVYGFPLLGELSSQGNLTSGVVSALTGLGDDLSTFQISAQIQPGNSGGPVFDRYGAIAGVVVSTANQDYFAQQSGNIPQDVNFAITADITQSFLRANNVRYEESDSVEELRTADIAERAQSFTGALLCYR